MNDNSKSLSNIRQAVEAVETSAKDEAVPAILKRALQADAGSDLLKILAKTIDDISKKQLEMAAAIQSNTEKIGSVESRMITCQVGNLYIGNVPQSKWTKEFPIKLTGYKKTPKMEMALQSFALIEGGIGVFVSGAAKSPTSAEISAYGWGGLSNAAFQVRVSYVACGN